jgi:hypothetical protein
MPMCHRPIRRDSHAARKLLNSALENKDNQAIEQDHCFRQAKNASALAGTELTMTRIIAASRRPVPLANYLRPPLFAASWLVLVALATAVFFAPRGSEAQPEINDAVGFGCSTAIAGAAAAIVAFALGGRMRWAVEMALTVLLVVAITALLLLYFLWIDPTVARMRMDPWTLLRLQSDAGRWAEQLAGYHGPHGAAVGVVFGALAGLLTMLGRRWPRLATCTALAILFALASDSGRQFTLDLLTGLGGMLRARFVPWTISDDQISTSGMLFGAIAGCVVAELAMYATSHRACRPRQSDSCASKNILQSSPIPDPVAIPAAPTTR